MLYELFNRIYNYLFPEKSIQLKLEYESIFKEALEGIETSIVMVPLVKHTDEELSLSKAKKLDMDPIIYKYLYMKQCEACHKLKFCQNVAYVTKENSKNDFLVMCKDDEACIKEVTEKAKVK